MMKNVQVESHSQNKNDIVHTMYSFEIFFVVIVVIVVVFFKFIASYVCSVYICNVYTGLIMSTLNLFSLLFLIFFTISFGLPIFHSHPSTLVYLQLS